MTQKEAIEKALKMLGGRANLQDIYPLAMEIGDFSGSQKPKNTIRNCLQTSPKCFRPSPGKPKGWWELVSYQEELALLKQQVSDLEEKNRQLQSIPKAVDLIEKMLPEMMDVCMHERMKADPLRIVLRHLGYEEAAAVFDAWISEKEDELVNALEKLKIQIRNVSMTGQNATYNENNR